MFSPVDTAATEPMNDIHSATTELSVPAPTAGSGTPSSIASTTMVPATLPPVTSKPASLTLRNTAREVLRKLAFFFNIR